MKPTILFVTHSSNWPLTDGKRQRTWFLLDGLSQKYTVDVLLIGYQNDKDAFNENTNSIHKLFFIDALGFDLSRIAYPYYLLSKKHRVQKKLFIEKCNVFFHDLYAKTQYACIFSRYLQPLLLLDIPKNCKVVCDIDDVYFETQQSKIKRETNFKQKLKLQALFFLGAKEVKLLLNRIDVSIIVKESDSSFYGLKHASCLPNLPFSFFITQEKLPETNCIDTSSMILSFGFIGKLSYKPNYQGLINFINLIWNPLMKNKLEARLVIAGSGLIPEILSNAISSSKNIDLLGFVEMPELFWNKISILVVPINEGGGSNIKIAEAFINGKSVIAHPFASRGYEGFIDSDHLILPKNDKHWIEIMSSSLVSTPEQRQLLSEKAKKTFDLNHWNQTLFSIMS